MAKSKDDKSTSTSSKKPQPEWDGSGPGKKVKFPGIPGVQKPAEWSAKKIRQMVKDHPQIKKHFKNI